MASWFMNQTLGWMMGLMAFAGMTVPNQPIFLRSRMCGIELTLAWEQSDTTRYLDLAEEIYHLNGAHCSIEPFITAFCPGSFDGLVEAIGSKNPENNGNRGIESDGSNAF